MACLDILYVDFGFYTPGQPEIRLRTLAVTLWLITHMKLNMILTQYIGIKPLHSPDSYIVMR